MTKTHFNTPAIVSDHKIFQSEVEFYAKCIVRAAVPEVRDPVAAYGQHVAAGTRPNREESTQFYRALTQAKLPGYTHLADQLKDWAETYGKFEDEIARRVYEAVCCA